MAIIVSNQALKVHLHIYMLWRSSQPIPGAPMITDNQLDRLVLAAHDEAVHILKDILHILIPKLEVGKQLTLQPLGATSPGHSKRNKGCLHSEEYATDDDDMEDDCSDSDAGLDVSDSEAGIPKVAGSAANSQHVDHTIDKISARASHHVAGYLALCDDLDAILSEAGLSETDYAIPSPHPLITIPVSSNPQPTDPNSELKKQEQKKVRQLHWQTTAQEINQVLQSASSHLLESPLPHLSQKNVTTLHPLIRGLYVIMCTQQCAYIGQVLDMYKKGESSRYGSVDSSTMLNGLSWLSLHVYLPLTVNMGSTNSDEESDADTTGPEFTCAINRKKFHLHTHAPVDNVIFNLGLHALVGDDILQKSLTPLATSRWNILQSAKLKPILAKVPVLKF
ncbi:hypothetical protein C0993_001350 [Termitomyces sp. T159_Od127]|nr:hypothetical protein C0993_001350 [Termitomyces sp. T159_Od127]